jgi:hypothetical protein
MKKIFTISMLMGILFIGNTVYSQTQKSALVEYDFQTESYKFYKVKTKQIKRKHSTIKDSIIYKDTTIYTLVNKPVGYRGIPTKVVVKNVNTLFYDVNFTTEHRMEGPVNGDQSVGMLAENFTSGFGAFSDLVGEVQGSEIYQSLWSDGEFQGIEGLKEVLTGSGAGQASFKNERQMVLNASGKLDTTQLEMTETVDEIKYVLTELYKTELILDQLKKLQLNRKLSPEEMKKQAKKLINPVNPTKDLSGVVEKWQENTGSLDEAYSDYMKLYRKYKIQSGYVHEVIGNVQEGMEPNTFTAQMDEFENEIDEKLEMIESNVEALKLLKSEFSSDKIKADYLAIYEAYIEIDNIDPTFEYSISNDLDVTTLTMQFVDGQSEVDSLGNKKVVKTRHIEIPTAGGLRINSSAGLSFIRFFNGHETYTSETGKVASVKGDAFAPTLTTMFHFYKQTPKPVSVGGAFGFGIPTEGDKDFIYMLGSSLIFGKSQRVILNLGAFGGKTDRLSGYSVGDAIAQGAVVPTQKVFDFGFYAGVTLNINKLF